MVSQMRFNMASALLMAMIAISMVFVVDGQLRHQTSVPSTKKIVCLYNSTSFSREGLAKVTLQDLDPVLTSCDYLVYAHIGIDPATNKVRSLNKADLDDGSGLFRLVTGLKAKNPRMKVLLGVGYADTEQDIYTQLLDNKPAFAIFINSLYTMIKQYNFDGVDLAWEFKPNKPKRIRSSIGSFWYSSKKFLALAGKPLDENAAAHKQAFVDLVRQTKDAIRPENFVLSITVLPNVNTSLFYDVAALIPHVDFVVLCAYDYQTWERNPNEADYSAPIYALHERIPESNLDYQVSLWLSLGAPAYKIIPAIPTHGRSWKLSKDSTKTGVPPVLEIEEPGAAGIQSQQPGFLSYPEVCQKLPNPSNQHLRGENQPLRREVDALHRYGSYAFRLPDDSGNHGFWISYDDPESAQYKADYVVKKSLGGVAIHDLSNDDFRGGCNGEKFPILNAAKRHLSTH